MKTTFEHSRRALVVFDRSAKTRDWLLGNARTNAEVEAWQQAENEALAKVRRAFYEDTKDRNCLDNCMIVDVTFIRRCVAGT